MVDVFTEIIIKKPIKEVYDFAVNPDNAPEWYVNIKSAVWKTPKPLKIGSQVIFVAHFIGRKLEYTYEFIDLIPNRQLVMRTAEGPFPMQTTYTWKAVDENTTKMTLRNTGEPSGFSTFIAPLLSKMMKIANKKDLINLKNIIEMK